MLRSCEELNCEVTQNTSLFSSSDAVVFHHHDLRLLLDYPNRSFKSQKFVYYSIESPHKTYYFGPENYFNWIMSYSHKSDISFTYGSKWRKCSSTCRHLPYDPHKILSTKKNKGIIGYISNCNSSSGREIIVEKMGKYIPTTIFGKCSYEFSKKNENICKQGDFDCEEKVINTYYFYFSLENAVCDEYVTEKYWNRYKFNSVPIVIRRDIYENLNIPSSSFIAVDDFKSAKEMGDYLNYLMNNTKEYLKYFEYRKQNIEVMDEKEYHLMNGFCNLCKKLYENDKSNDVIKNVSINYLNINRCISKKDSDKFSNLW